MKRIIITLFLGLLAIAGYAQNQLTVNGFVYSSDGYPLAGATIKAIGNNASVQSSQDGTFEIVVPQYCNFIEASFEGYIPAKAELDGSMVLFRLKVDKNYAKMKAIEEAKRKEAEEAARVAAAEKAEQERIEAEKARLAAERDAAERAKAEEKARIAAEKARIAAEKEKAQQEAYARALAEKEAQQKAKMETKQEAQKGALANQQVATATTIKEAKPTHKSRQLDLIKSGYGQYVEVAPVLNIGGDHASMALRLNYIGGYRFNKNLFLGLGTGINLNTGQDEWWYYYADYRMDYGNMSLPLITVPIFVNFRVDWGKRLSRLNFYSSFSAGAQVAVCEPYERFQNNHQYLWRNDSTTPSGPPSGPHNEVLEFARKNSEVSCGFDVGANYRLTNKLSMHAGVGYRFGLRLKSIMLRDFHNDMYFEPYGALAMHSIKFTVGISF